MLTDEGRLAAAKGRVTVKGARHRRSSPGCRSGGGAVSDREAARRIADAVRFEARRAFRAGPAGVYVPPGFTATGEPSFAQAECLLDGGGKVLRVRSRFLHLQGPEEPPGDGAAE